MEEGLYRDVLIQMGAHVVLSQLDCFRQHIHGHLQTTRDHDLGLQGQEVQEQHLFELAADHGQLEQVRLFAQISEHLACSQLERQSTPLSGVNVMVKLDGKVERTLDQTLGLAL